MKHVNLGLTIEYYVMDIPKEAEVTLQCWLDDSNGGGAHPLHQTPYSW